MTRLPNLFFVIAIIFLLLAHLLLWQVNITDEDDDDDGEYDDDDDLGEYDDAEKDLDQDDMGWQICSLVLRQLKHAGRWSRMPGYAGFRGPFSKQKHKRHTFHETRFENRRNTKTGCQDTQAPKIVVNIVIIVKVVINPFISVCRIGIFEIGQMVLGEVK